MRDCVCLARNVLSLEVGHAGGDVVKRACVRAAASKTLPIVLGSSLSASRLTRGLGNIHRHTGTRKRARIGISRVFSIDMTNSPIRNANTQPIFFKYRVNATYTHPQATIGLASLEFHSCVGGGCGGGCMCTTGFIQATPSTPRSLSH